jgi:hypothetical protein
LPPWFRQARESRIGRIIPSPGIHENSCFLLKDGLCFFAGAGSHDPAHCNALHFPLIST